MMQTLRSSDVLRCILLNVPKGPNLACSVGGLTCGKAVSKSTVWKETLAGRRERVTLAQWDGFHLVGLASARMRSGHRAWEIDHLFLASDRGRSAFEGRGSTSDSNPVALELIERIAQEVAGHKGQRVFLRLSSDSPMLLCARRAGFFPCYEETLMEGGPSGRQNGLPPHLGGWQEVLPEDDYSVFQLYCAGTPQPVREAVGLTFDQWRDAQEPCGRRRSWVAKLNGKVVGCLGLSRYGGRYGGITAGEVLAHPGSPELWEELVGWAQAQKGPQRWLVPDYQELVAELLLRRRFRKVARYNVMIKMVAAPVLSRGMAAVEA